MTTTQRSTYLGHHRIQAHPTTLKPHHHSPHTPKIKRGTTLNRGDGLLAPGPALLTD